MSGITTGTALLISSAVALAATGVSTGLAMANEPSAPKSADSAAAGQAAAQAQALALTKRRGMAATTLTSPMGTGPATTAKATLG